VTADYTVKFKRHLDETVDKLRGEYGAELGKEQVSKHRSRYKTRLTFHQAQTEVRFAAVAARQVRTSSHSAPYNVSEAESARQDRRLKEARQELEKHPGVFVIPHPAPDGGDESDEESLDETEKQQAALIWAWEQLEKEKKRKEDPESEEEGGGRTACALQTTRKSQQQDLSKSEDNAYKVGAANSCLGKPDAFSYLEDGSRRVCQGHWTLARKRLRPLRTSVGS
jgi:hypothetical protein